MFDPSRRAFLREAAIGTLGLGSFSSALGQKKDDVKVITGKDVPGLEAFDQMMSSFIKENSVPGAAVAITRKGKLVYSRGFGYADVEKKEAVQPGDLFRIASISKPFTAVAILQLEEKGDLKLDDKVVDHLQWEPFLEKDAKVDPRWKQVTILQALQHTGGWDRDQSYDPIGIPWKIARAMKKQPPVTHEDVVRYMMGKPLDFDPGTRYAYSNLGYLLLGRVIEVVSGQPYEKYVQRNVLEPLSIKDMKLGKALLEDRAKNEVHYYEVKARTGRALAGPHIGEKVPAIYGADNFEAYQAHGGWIASAVDLVRFAAAFDDPAHCPILKEKTIETMWARPEGAAGYRKDGSPRAVYYGCGWSVRGVDKGKINTWHNGLIAGSSTLLVRRWDGLNWAVLFNIDSNPKGKDLADLVDPLMHETADKIKTWPEGKW